MRLIGGNISDTPVKEIGDGSAFSVGGSVAAPDLVVLGSWGSATAISATNWAACLQACSTCWASSSYATGWVKMSNTKLINVFRRASDDALYYGVIDLDGNGSVDTVNNATSLSGDFTSNKGVVVVRVPPGEDDEVVIASAHVTSANKTQLAMYDLSSATLTKSGSVIEKALTSDAASRHAGFNMVLCDDNYGILFNHESGATFDGTPFNYNGTQAFGTPVSSGYYLSTEAASSGIAYLSGEDNVVYSLCDYRGTKWTLTEAAPPTLAKANINSANETAWGYGQSHMAAQQGSIIHPASGTETANGEIAWVTRLGVGHWLGGSEELNVQTTLLGEETAHNNGIFGNSTVAPFSRFNIEFVQVDVVGDWVRGVVVGAYGPTTGLQAMPMNVNTVTGQFVSGDASTTTNISPHANAPINFGAFYLSTGPHILIFCEDTAAAPSYIELPVTV